MPSHVNTFKKPVMLTLCLFAPTLAHQRRDPKIGQQLAGDKLAFFDAAAALESDLPALVCGQETFYEHVHFNFDGNFRLGRAGAEQIGKMLPTEISRSASANGWASQDICERRRGLADWNRCAVVEVVMDRLHRPPLSSQLNNAQRLDLLGSEAKELRHRMNPTTATKGMEIYMAAINRAPDDHYLHENFAEYLESANDLNRATGQWQQVCGLLPHNCLTFYQVDRLLSLQNQWVQAEAALSKAVALRPRMAEGWYELGNVQSRH